MAYLEVTRGAQLIKCNIAHRSMINVYISIARNNLAESETSRSYDEPEYSTTKKQLIKITYDILLVLCTLQQYTVNKSYVCESYSL